MAQPSSTKQAKDKAEADQAVAEKPKQKRTMLTPAQRIAKMEAELEAARVKATEKGQAKVGKLSEKLNVLVEKRDKLNAEIKSLEDDIEALSPADVNGASGAVDESESSDS